MDALDIFKICVRRWWVMVPILVMAGVSGFGLAKGLTPEYHAYGSYAVVFAHPESIKGTDDPRTANPLSADNGGLLGEALTADLVSPELQASLGGRNRGWPTGQADTGQAYRVGLPENSMTYLVETWGDSQTEVAKTVGDVLAAAPARLKAIQNRAAVPESSQYTTFITAPTQVVAIPPQSGMKLILTMVGVGLLAGAGLSVLVDRLLSRREERSRRARRPRRTIPGGQTGERQASPHSELAALSARGPAFAQRRVAATDDRFSPDQSRAESQRGSGRDAEAYVP